MPFDPLFRTIPEAAGSSIQSVNTPLIEHLPKTRAHQAVLIHIVHINAHSCLLLIRQFINIRYFVELLNDLERTVIRLTL